MKKQKNKKWDLTNPMEFMKCFNDINKSKIDKIYDQIHKYHLAKSSNKDIYITSSEACLSSPYLHKLFYSVKQNLMIKKQLKGSDKTVNVLRMAEANNLFTGARIFSTWRNTATVYQIDEGIADQAANAKICPETPSTIFNNLPEWAVYMKLPEPVEYDSMLDTSPTSNEKSEYILKKLNRSKKIIGFWAIHDRNYTKNGEESLLEIFYHLDFQTADELKSYPMVAARLGVSSNLTVKDSLTAYYGNLENKDAAEVFIKPLENILSLLLWLCVEEPDVSNLNNVQLSRRDLKKSKLIKSKLSGKFVAPIKETNLTIAKRMGGEVREWNKQIEAAKQQGLPKRRIPHIRRGHWNGVWIGSGDHKTYKTYWQKPVFVNASLTHTES